MKVVVGGFVGDGGFVPGVTEKDKLIDFCINLSMISNAEPEKVKIYESIRMI